MGATRGSGRRGSGLPVRTYEVTPGVPPVRILRFPVMGHLPDGPPEGYAHTHDFLALAYFERNGGSVRLGDREWRIEAGDAYVIAPGEVVGMGADAGGFKEVQGWTVSFPPEALGEQVPGAFLCWRAHPLLFPFVGGAAGGAQRLTVPPEERDSWTGRFSALDADLTGYWTIGLPLAGGAIFIHHCRVLL